MKLEISTTVDKAGHFLALFDALYLCFVTPKCSSMFLYFLILMGKGTYLSKIVIGNVVTECDKLFSFISGRRRCRSRS